MIDAYNLPRNKVVQGRNNGTGDSRAWTQCLGTNCDARLCT